MYNNVQVIDTWAGGGNSVNAKRKYTNDDLQKFYKEDDTQRIYEVDLSQGSNMSIRAIKNHFFLKAIFLRSDNIF